MGRKAASEIRELRKFGLTLGLIIVGLFGVFGPLLHHRKIPLWPWVVCAAVSALPWVSPFAARLLRKIWFRIGHVLGAVNSRIILGTVYFLLVTPMAIVLRFMRKDPLRLAFSSDEKTYRLTRVLPDKDLWIKEMERPF